MIFVVWIYKQDYNFVGDKDVITIIFASIFGVDHITFYKSSIAGTIIEKYHLDIIFCIILILVIIKKRYVNK